MSTCADHIVAVYQGGGLCDLENLRTLCVICHQVSSHFTVSIEMLQGCDIDMYCGVVAKFAWCAKQGGTTKSNFGQSCLSSSSLQCVTAEKGVQGQAVTTKLYGLELVCRVISPFEGKFGL